MKNFPHLMLGWSIVALLFYPMMSFVLIAVFTACSYVVVDHYESKIKAEKEMYEKEIEKIINCQSFD